MKKCLCDNPTCAKCLGLNCKDDNCMVHSIKDKIRMKTRILNNLKNQDEIFEFQKEIEKLNIIRNI